MWLKNKPNITEHKTPYNKITNTVFQMSQSECMCENMSECMNVWVTDKSVSEWMKVWINVECMKEWSECLTK